VPILSVVGTRAGRTRVADMDGYTRQGLLGQAGPAHLFFGLLQHVGVNVKNAFCVAKLNVDSLMSEGVLHAGRRVRGNAWRRRCTLRRLVMNRRQPEEGAA
jgi:hypothetical protein